MFPKGLYISFIQRAFEALALNTFFDERHADFNFPTDTLTAPLPEGCFNVIGAWMYSGSQCDFHDTRKIWWKRNYFTEGKGYIANNKEDNRKDPFFPKNYPSDINIRAAVGGPNENLFSLNRHLFYNIQNGNIMFSSSCKSAGTKVHIYYNGTGCAIGEVPIIPIFLRTAIEDYLTVEALLLRIANDVDPRRWQSLLGFYNTKLDKEGMNGSWHNAEYMIKSLNESQRSDLYEYLGRPSWGSYI